MVKSNSTFSQAPLPQQRRVVFYRERSGRIPVLRWLDSLPARHQTKCLGLIRRLASEDDRLQFPHTRHLIDGIHELRVRFGRIRYRIFYFFYRGNIAVITHGIIKKTSAVPSREIEIAQRRRSQFENNPSRHTQEVVNV